MTCWLASEHQNDRGLLLMLMSLTKNFSGEEIPMYAVMLLYITISVVLFFLFCAVFFNFSLFLPMIETAKMRGQFLAAPVQQSISMLTIASYQQ